jgi:hypothetical protein
MILPDPGSSPGATRIGGVAEIAGPFDKLRVTATLATTHWQGKRRQTGRHDTTWNAADGDVRRARIIPALSLSFRLPSVIPAEEPESSQ